MLGIRIIARDHNLIDVYKVTSLDRRLASQALLRYNISDKISTTHLKNASDKHKCAFIQIKPDVYV